MTEYSPIQIPLAPTLGVCRMNVLVVYMKKALGPFGEGVDLIDAKKVNAELSIVEQQAKGLDKAFDQAFSAKSVEEMRDQVKLLLGQINELDDKGKPGEFADRYLQFLPVADDAADDIRSRFRHAYRDSLTSAWPSS